MSLKNGVMDWYFQQYNIPRILIARNLDDLLDLWFEIFNPNLHLDENLWNIINHYRNYLE